MFGGPWIWMNHLPQLSEQRLHVAQEEIRLFKQLRTRLRSGKVLHLSARPTGDAVDAIGSHHLPTDTVIAFVFRAEIPDSDFNLRIGTLDPARMYRVRFQESDRVLVMRGDEIAAGVQIELPHEWFAEVVYIEPE
jgi:hypothetical protein